MSQGTCRLTHGGCVVNGYDLHFQISTKRTLEIKDTRVTESQEDKNLGNQLVYLAVYLDVLSELIYRAAPNHFYIFSSWPAPLFFTH